MSNFNFNDVFEAVDTADVNVDEHHNGTGYFDSLRKADVGQDVCKFTDNKDRRGIIIPLLDGRNIVIFERYAMGKHDVLVANLPTSVKSISAVLGLNGQISDDRIMDLVGFSHRKEAGQRIANVTKMFQSF